MDHMEENGPLVAPSRAVERQIRRYVNAPVHRFVAVAPPELAPICLGELLSLGLESAEASPAGAEFSGKLRTAYTASLWLRTASRVLCRMARFRAGAVEELFSRCLALHWELWLPGTIPLSVESHVIHSRIEHEGAATRTVHRAIQRRFESRGIVAPPWAIRGEPELPSSDPLARQRVLVHVEDNLCTISLDMTGGHLHQRGYRLKHAGAPLRETLAAAILMRSGWDGETPLVDGMCGAGTFAIEAGLMACGMPPGGRRPFLFESWPSFEDKTWAYLRRKAEEQAAARPGAPILGVDLDPASLEISRENARRAGLENAIQWVPADFFQLDPGKLGLPPGTVVLNPPYGRRLRENPARTYERVGAHLREAFGGWRAVVLAPDRESAMKLRMRQARAWKVSHGGAPVVVMMGRME